MMDEIEEVLLTADVGVASTQRLLDSLNKEVAANHIRDQDGVQSHLEKLLAGILEENNTPLDLSAHSPTVILVIGINGSGKTTTIGKLAKHWSDEGKKVLIGAGDTFRAAAVEQLQAWADRSGVTCIRQTAGADPSAVAYDAVQAGVARKMDVVLIDTAGRLQTNQNLMEELKKVKRVVGKVIPEAPHETWLVLDATIGQNSLSQAKLFNEALDISGVVMTKLDGTAKGGVLFNLADTLKRPVRYIGVGEQAEDLQAFEPAEFVRALFGKQA